MQKMKKTSKVIATIYFTSIEKNGIGLNGTKTTTCIILSMKVICAITPSF